MAQFYSGKDGKVLVDGQQLAKVGGWSLSAQVEALETTSLADIARDYTSGLKSANGSCAVFYYADAPVSLLSKVVKVGAATDADKVTITLGWGEKAVTFQALLTSAELGCRVGEVMQAQVSFSACGDLQGVAL
jgi:hypothetical protein